MEFAEMIPVMTGALGGMASAGLLRGPIKTLDDIWFSCIGSKVDKWRIQKEVELEKYKESILKEVVEIPGGNLQEPKLSILGPALEASKYYIEEEILREMFGKLIASSMDDRKNGLVRASFVEIIKQMNSLDAENLSLIHNGKSANSTMVVSLDIVDQNSDIIATFTNLYAGNLQGVQNLIVPSIENLQRLGLINIRYDRTKKYGDYDVFKKTDKYKEVEDYIEVLKNQSKLFDQIKEDFKNSDLSKSLSSDAKKDLENAIFSNPKRILIRPGIIEETAFGEDFCLICLESHQ